MGFSLVPRPRLRLRFGVFGFGAISLLYHPHNFLLCGGVRSPWNTSIAKLFGALYSAPAPPLRFRRVMHLKSAADRSQHWSAESKSTVPS